MSTALLFQIQSFLIICTMILGIFFIKNKRQTAHVKTMSVAIIWDLLLILQIEFSRSAIATASAMTSNPMILNIHVAIAVSCVILYALMVWSGRKVLAGDMNWRSKHRVLGITTLVMRLLTFITSFYAV